MWNDVKTEEDILRLMSAYGDFHDACMVSLAFRSGAFVDEDRAMHFGNADEHIVSVLFQRQGAPKAVELQFSGLRRLQLMGWQEDYVSCIFGAHLAFYDALLPGERVIAWSDNSDCDIAAAMRGSSDTYIIANALRWRVVEDAEAARLEMRER